MARRLAERVTHTRESRSELDLGSAALASFVAGAVAGALTGSWFPVTSTEVWSVERISFLALGLLIGGYVGGIVALLPGAVISLSLQKVAAVRLAPFVGAIIGAVLPVTFFNAIAHSGLDLQSVLGFGISGAIGGIVGGLTLIRMYGRTSLQTP